MLLTTLFVLIGVGILMMILASFFKSDSTSFVVFLIGVCMPMGALATGLVGTVITTNFDGNEYSRRTIYIAALSSDKLNCVEKYDLYKKLKNINENVKNAKEDRKSLFGSFVDKGVEKAKLIDLDRVKPYLKACKISDL